VSERLDRVVATSSAVVAELRALRRPLTPAEMDALARLAQGIEAIRDAIVAEIAAAPATDAELVRTAFADHEVPVASWRQ